MSRMELFHEIKSKNYIDMKYWFAKKRQAFTVPYEGRMVVNGRSYETYKYYKDGKTILILSSSKNYNNRFPYYEALFFYLDSNELYLTGKPVEYLVEGYFKLVWNKKMS